ncbi:MAG: hypothetical protein U1E42_06220 [Rhodospirillales bacterium]
MRRVAPTQAAAHRHGSRIGVGLCLAMFGLGLGPAGGAAAADAAPDLHVVTTAESLTIEAKSETCTATLARTGAAGAPFSFSSDCRYDAAREAETLARMMETALPTAADRLDGAAIVVESLERTFPEFSRRLAVAADRSPEWHGERARRSASFANATTLRIANTPPVYRELQEAMRRLRFDVRIAAVDKVQVGVPAETPFAEWLDSRRVDPRRQVPYDAEVTFRLIPS